MSAEVKHVLGISGGKDSAALAIYLNKLYSSDELPIEYYTCDTGRELAETYVLIEQLEHELRQPVKKYQDKNYQSTNEENPFDYYWKRYGGYLPAQNARWCTKNLKLAPFEAEIGDTPAISYVGIRGDEDREGYISTRTNIQSIFPFRRNIWSVDVIKKLLSNDNIENVVAYYETHTSDDYREKTIEIAKKPLSASFSVNQKLNDLLDIDVISFNKVVFYWLKTTDYPVGKLDYFPLVENEDILVRQDIFDLIEESNVDLPSYYLPREYEIDGEKGKYFRSRSGCFFCFYQQKIEWVWLLEQHPALFEEAKKYEKDGYTWIQEESLEQLSHPERVKRIKREHLKRMKRRYENLQTKTSWQDDILGVKKSTNTSDPNWLDELLDAEGDGCASCFI
ncbi:MAG: phosphoadenosine phosphosulfate reductase family protein [Marinilabiliaceae bacterium]|nr:phosphoadenosine phosphosulfate reductase family protein [Marinilabiliaceae bacterium]